MRRAVARIPGRALAGPGLLRHMATAEEPLVRLSTGGDLAEIRLCRPKKLNSLNMPMIHQLNECYKQLAPAGAKCVLLRGEGRALCAGGDVAEVRDGVLQGTSYPADFFFHEYLLDYHIATLHEREQICQVALWDGIVMGGGVGLSVHSPIRVATEKTLFAMPETAIGLFPDVGGTYALSRLKAGSPFGLYLGLTGQRIGAADAMYSGLATHFCPSDRVGDLEAALKDLGAHGNDPEAVGAAIDKVAAGATPDTAKASLEMNAAVIEKCFADGSSTEGVLAALQADGGAFAKGVLDSLRSRSPTSVKVAHEAIQRHTTATLRETFIMEYRIAQWCMRPQPESDFCEGIRAVLIDKDNKPVWSPGTIEEVSAEKVDGFFAPLPADHSRGELPL